MQKNRPPPPSDPSIAKMSPHKPEPTHSDQMSTPTCLGKYIVGTLAGGVANWNKNGFYPTVCLTSIYYRVTGNQELLVAPSETFVRLLKNKKSQFGHCLIMKT